MITKITRNGINGAMFVIPGDGAMGKASGAADSAAGDGTTGGAPILAAAGQPRCRGRTDYHCQRVPQICRPEFERPIGVGL